MAAAAGLAMSMTKINKKLGQVQLDAVAKVLDHWINEWGSREDQNPDYVVAMACEEKTSSHKQVFFSQVLPELEEYWFCRYDHCSMVSNSTCWIHDLPSGNFRCPHCGEQRRIYTEISNCWRTNKVLVINGQVALGDNELATGSSDGHAPATQVTIIPVQWPNISDSVLIQRIEDILSELDNELLAIHPKDRLTYVLENISSIPPSHTAWNMQHITPEVEATMDHLNNNMPVNMNRWQYSHIKKGYLGIQLDQFTDELNEPIGLMDFIRNWGLSVWIIHRAAAYIPGPSNRFARGFFPAATSSDMAAQGT
jgi:hypothetical protein